jgi:exopolysaccharide production protein ExoZ
MAKVAAVQLLRGAAATLVVCAHVFPTFIAGAAGVDVFFAISGFVIVVSSQRLLRTHRASLVFLQKRLIRIVPIYWLSTALTIGLLGSIHPETVTASFFFIPHVNEYSGNVLPVLEVGWTLNLEMFFYVLFALSLTVCSRMGTVVCLIAVALFGFAMFGARAGLPYAVAAYWTTPITLEFAFGTLVALAYGQGLKLSRAWGAATAILAMVIFVTLGNGDAQPMGWWRLVVWGVPSALIVVSSALVNWNLGFLAPVAALAGAASYAIYLTHEFTIAYAPKFLGGGIGRVIAALVVGLAIYLIVDFPIISFLLAARTAKARSIAPLSERGGELIPAFPR